MRGTQKEGDLKARRNIIRYYDLTFMCSPHVAVLCLFAPQREMTTFELIKIQISNSYCHGKEETEKIKKNKKNGARREYQ